MVLETLRGHQVRRHTGQTAGFTSSIALFPEDRLTVIVLCNIGTGGVAGRIGQMVAKVYVPALSLRTLEIQPDGDMQTVARLHELIERQLAGEANSAMLTKEARDSLATDLRAQTGSASLRMALCANSTLSDIP